MKKLCFIMCLILLMMMQTSCSYVDFENKLRQGIISSDDNNAAMEEFNQNAKPDEETELKHVGDEIVINDGVSEMTYIVSDVTVYDNLEAAGIDKEQIGGFVPDGGKKRPFVLVNVTVRNKKVFQEVDSYNIALFHLMNRELFDSDPWSVPLPEISYFSNAKSMDSEYFHYNLAEGEEMQCSLGWFLTAPVETAENLILHIGADIHSRNYVQLTSSENEGEGSTSL